MTTEIRNDAQDREAIAITIYNDDLALIREQRRLTLHSGVNRIALRDVAARIKPETTTLRSSGDATLQLLEQNFDYDLLNATSLLNHYVGKRVTVCRTHPASGAESREEATVLANNGGAILQYADRIETGLPAGARLAFADVPAALRDSPTLTVDLHSSAAGSQTVELAYLSKGFTWQADYVLNLARDEKTLNLAGWVTLDNQSGSSYADASLQLVAGDVAQLRDDGGDLCLFGELHEDAAPLMQEEALFEYHLYTLPRPTTLKNKQQKQVALLSAASVPVNKEYRLQNARFPSLARYRRRPEDGDKRDIEVYIEFRNDEASQLGVPLPKGVIRVYQDDSAGRPQFIGEDRIDHTAKNESIRLKLGNAFDVSGVWKSLECKALDSGRKDDKCQHYEIQCSIALSNAKSEAVTVKVVEPIPGDWHILEESHPHEKDVAHLAQWHIVVPAEGSTELRYKARLTI